MPWYVWTFICLLNFAVWVAVLLFLCNAARIRDQKGK